MDIKKLTPIKINDFFETEYIDFAIYSTYRSIASYVDGLKNVHRKIIWTVEKNNIVNSTKVISVASKSMDETEYLHGDKSIQDAVITLAKDYPGSNNINLLSPEGNYGYRTDHSPSAPRYIETMKMSYFNQILIKEDQPILIKQSFEGTLIEPKYLLPILPLILINGSEGIGNGFAQKILGRDPKRIIEIIKNNLKTGKGFREILPCVKNYKGKIYRDKDIKLKVWFEGFITKKNTTTLIITELPIMYDIDSYKKILEKLIDKKIIKSYKDGSNKNEYYIEVKCERSLTKNDIESLLKIFELKKAITENFTCISEDNSIAVFNNEKELLLHFIDFRLEKYEERRLYLIKKIEIDKAVIDEKCRFIKMILDEKIEINNKKRKEVEEDLIRNKFKLVDDSYDYLMKMPIYNLTEEQYNKLLDQNNKLSNEIELLKSKTNKDLWLEDLDKLKLN